MKYKTDNCRKKLMSLFENVLKVGYVSLFAYAVYYVYETREENKRVQKEALSELNSHLKKVRRVSESDSGSDGSEFESIDKQSKRME